MLDEPTAGVDVELRQTLWQFIASLNKRGNTVLLTTHYLEEAEALCTRIAMLKLGKVVALAGTAALLQAASSNLLRFKLDGELPAELAKLARVTGRIVQVPAHDAVEIESHLAALRRSGLVAQDVEVRKADLEDVFLQVMSREEALARPEPGLRRAVAGPASGSAPNLTSDSTPGATPGATQDSVPMPAREARA